MKKNLQVAIVVAGLAIFLFLSFFDDSIEPIKHISEIPTPLHKVVKSPSSSAVYAFPVVHAKPPSINNPKESVVDAQVESWDESAIEQMREARLHGDERAPPIIHDQEQEDRPTEKELESPEVYSNYETRQEMKLKTAYMQAAPSQILQLKQQLQAMHEAGVDKNSIQEAEEKITQLQLMTERLLQQHPELTKK